MITSVDGPNLKIPLVEPQFSGNESVYLQQCISSGYVSSIGPFVSRFEKELSDIMCSAGAVAVSSGTAALHVMLLVAGVKPNDLVIIPTYTFIGTANSIRQCFSVPWLMDIVADDLTLDHNLLKKTLESETNLENGICIHSDSGRTVSAIMPVHTLGATPRMDLLADIAEEFNLSLIVDGAAALGTKFNDKPLSKTGASMTALSFNGNKVITTGGGGAVISDNLDLLDFVRKISGTAKIEGSYNHDRVAFNYSMSNLHAAVGCAQLELLPEFLKTKERIKRNYETGLKDVVSLTPVKHNSYCKSSHWISAFTLSTPELANSLRSHLNNVFIEARLFWKPLHLQKPYQNAIKTRTNVSDDIWQRMMPLPSSTNLTKEKQEYIIKVILDWAEMSH